MSSHDCEGITRSGFVCSHRSKFTTDRGKHYCKTHWKQLVHLPIPAEDTTECSICYESVNNKLSVRTVCNHVFCKKCFIKWTRTHDTCPLCRALVVPASTKPEVYILDDLNDQDLFTFMNHLINENRLYIDRNVIRIANAYEHENALLFQFQLNWMSIRIEAKSLVLVKFTTSLYTIHLQMGHVDLYLVHREIHRLWNIWPQLNMSISNRLFIQIEHNSSDFCTWVKQNECVSSYTDL